MTVTDQDLRHHVSRWYAEGGPTDAVVLFKALLRHMVIPSRLAHLEPELEDARVELLRRLLDRETRLLSGVTSPTAYAVHAFRNVLVTVVRAAHRREGKIARLHALGLDASTTPAEDELRDITRRMSRVHRAAAALRPEARLLVYLVANLPVHTPADVETTLGERSWILPTPPIDRGRAAEFLSLPYETANKTLQRALKTLTAAATENEEDAS